MRDFNEPYLLSSGRMVILAFWSGPLWRFKLAQPWAERTLPCFSAELRDGGRVGLESQGGVIRADSPRVRVWSWVDHRCGAEVGCASAHGAGGGAERSSGAAQEDRTSGGEDGRSGVVDRCDSGVGPYLMPLNTAVGLVHELINARDE